MPIKKITELEQASSVNNDAKVLITQNVSNNSNTIPALRLAALSDLIETLRASGINNGYVTTTLLQSMYPNIVKKVESVDGGIKVTLYNDTEQNIPISAGGLSFDTGYVDANGLLHLSANGEDIEGFEPFFVGIMTTEEHDNIIALTQKIETDIGDIKAYLGYSDKDIVGLQVDYQNGTFKRLAGAYGKAAGEDFDVFPMYGGRRRCNVEDDGTIVAYYGDDGSDGGYEYLDDDAPQVMVYQPAFYYKVVPLEYDKIENGMGYHLRKANYYVSSKPKSGFKRHPAFYDESGNAVDYILFSAYEGSMIDVSRAHGGTGGRGWYVDDTWDSTEIEYGEGDLLCSTGNQKPISGLCGNTIGSRANLETMAHNRGTGWHLSTIQAECANLLLMMIELGTMNSQSAIGTGIGGLSNTDEKNYACLTGSTADLGNTTGNATETIGAIAGQETIYTGNDMLAISYRGIENPWGNIIKYVNGINIWGDGTMRGGQPYVADDYNFSENKRTQNYNPVGFTLSNGHGYISAMGWGGDENSEYDWLLLPSDRGGSSTQPVGDYVYAKANLNGYKAVALGGSSIAKAAFIPGVSGIGAFHWMCHYDSDYRSKLIGGRIMYVPTATQST